ncbi:hypothetical protein TMatcc_004320 [Talaromyces marneffei ATCC 18224]
MPTQSPSYKYQVKSRSHHESEAYAILRYTREQTPRSAATTPYHTHTRHAHCLPVTANPVSHALITILPLCLRSNTRPFETAYLLGGITIYTPQPHTTCNLEQSTGVARNSCQASLSSPFNHLLSVVVFAHPSTNPANNLSVS